MALLLILLAAFVVRFGALVAARNATPILDERSYTLRAEGLLDGKGYLGSYQSWVRHKGYKGWVELPQYPGAYQPPLYAFFLAGIMGVTDRSLFAVKLVQVLLSTGTVALVYWLGRSWLDRRRGLIAAAVCALYPNLIAFSHYLFTETLFIFLFTSAVCVLTCPKELPSRNRFLFAGFLLGLSALTRSVGLYMTVVLFLWIAWTHRGVWQPALRRIAACGAIIVIVLTPWAVRNFHVHGGFVLIDTNGGFNLWRGNAPTTFQNRSSPDMLCYKPPFDFLPLSPVMNQWVGDLVELTGLVYGTKEPTDLQIVECAENFAWKYIKLEPAVFIGRACYKMLDMWNPTSFLLRHFCKGGYGTVPPSVEFVISWLAILSYVLVMVFGMMGLVRWRNDPHAWLVAAFILLLCSIHALVFGLTRFRLPLMPFIMVFAAYGITTLGKGPKANPVKDENTSLGGESNVDGEGKARDGSPATPAAAGKPVRQSWRPAH